MTGLRLHSNIAIVMPLRHGLAVDMTCEKAYETGVEWRTFDWIESDIPKYLGPHWAQ